MATSSPAPSGFKDLQEELNYYKSQYEQLESELQEFQASSKELEVELEKDVEAAEKRERALTKKVESLGYEVDEWKTKHRQSKTEAGATQATLQKEITTIRDQTRTLQMKLRDIEVANDDFERQARHTTSSLEDLESKYNQTLERSVLLEEEVKRGEQEREELRIEAQRLRDELSDLRVEAEITQEKLRAAESTAAGRLKRISQLSDLKNGAPHSPTSEGSIDASTNPTTQSTTSTATTTSDALTPPSPPTSDASLSRPELTVDATATAQPDPEKTPKPGTSTSTKGHSRNTSATPNIRTPAFASKRSGVPTPRPSGLGLEPMPRSQSLYQIRGLIGKMRDLEHRVHSVRSKLPAPTHTPPRASPRGVSPRSNTTGPSNLSTNLPSTVTMRSNKKRTSTGTSNSLSQPAAQPEEESARVASPRKNRLSYSSRAESGDTERERPSSRSSQTMGHQFARPASRTETGTRRESYRPSSAAEVRRPRSSMSGRQSAQGYRQSFGFTPDERLESEQVTPTPRRTTLERGALSGIPAPSGLPAPPASLARRQSAQTLNHSSSSNGIAPMTPAPKKSVKNLAQSARKDLLGAEDKSKKNAGSSPGYNNDDLGETW